jgi:hypothetical protein
MFLLIGFTLSIFFLLWFKLLEFVFGITLLGIIFVMLSSHSLHILFRYLRKTKFPKTAIYVLPTILVLFVLTSIVPSTVFVSGLTEDVVKPEEVKALEWINQNTSANSTVLATLKEGFAVNYIAQRRNVVDEDFLLAENPDQLIQDVRVMYKVRITATALELLNKYGVDYIYFSENAKQVYDLDGLFYVKDECFSLVYNEEVKVYEVLCKA